MGAALHSRATDHSCLWTVLKIMAERVGFDALNAEPCTALHDLVQTQGRNTYLDSTFLSISTTCSEG
jgi:hypothetical protein